MNIADESSDGTGVSRYREIDALHRRCGIYTRPEVVRRILDAVGWREDIDLSRSSLLEPAAGDGAFIVEAGRRLIASYVRHDVELNAQSLASRIRAVELHPGEARSARYRVVASLREAGVHERTANACARNWIVTADFLVTDLPSDVYSHAVGNPPYVRWSKVPSNLKAKYERLLPRIMTGGDLFLPFLDRALELLRPGGQCGFLCSDRWRFMGFAQGFRDLWLPRLDIQTEDRLQAAEAFLEDVDSYPSILIATKRKQPRPKPVSVRRSGSTLADLDCTIKVGPALGHTPAFVLEHDEDDVEPELLRPWIGASEIAESAVAWHGRRVIAMHGDDGKLIELRQFPLLKARLARHRSALSKRSIVRNGAHWFQPIDRVRAIDWTRPKLLIPELSKVPRCAIDRSGAIPSHGVYAIFAPDDNVDGLYGILGDGQLARALQGIAPLVKGGYVRCYRRFLSMIHVAAD
jgi:hypothetical protein